MNECSGSTRVVRLAADPFGEAIPLEAFHARIVGQCADALAMHARDRATRPLAFTSGAEAMIRRQSEAVCSLESNTLAHVSAWWEEAAASPDPWKAWATLFVIGSTGGPAVDRAILTTLEVLPEEDERWIHASEALALARVPDGIGLGGALVRAKCPAARAVGVDLLARWGAVSPKLLREHLRASEPAVVASAARSAARAGVVSELVPELFDATRVTSASAAWEAVRALTLAGVREPYLELRHGGPLARRLGAGGVELLVMLGEDTDIDIFETLISGTPMTPALLSAVARFGNVTAWSFLLHHLAEPALSNAAASALRTLFGDLVPQTEEASFSAWKRAISAAELDPSVRYRAGKPWQPGLVLVECTSGALPRVEVERRVDELVARTGVRASVDLGLWDQEARATLAAFAAEVARRAPHGAAGASR